MQLTHFTLQAVFGIPIGILGAGFETVVALENEDNVEELEREENLPRNGDAAVGSSFEKRVYDFVNGDGSKISQVSTVTRVCTK